MSQSKHQLDHAADRALVDLSSKIHARSQPSTPQNDKLKQVPQDLHTDLRTPPILDLLLSTKQPKSKLRQLAQMSAKKYKRHSLAQPHEQQSVQPTLDVDSYFDLGSPSRSVFHPESPSKSSFSRRQSLSPRKSLSPIKCPKPAVDEKNFGLLLNKLNITDPVPNHSTAPILPHAPPQRKSRRVTIIHISSSSEQLAPLNSKLENLGQAEGEVCETKECDGGQAGQEDEKCRVLELPNFSQTEPVLVQSCRAEEEETQQSVNKDKNKLLPSDSDIGDDDPQPISNRIAHAKIPDSQTEDEDEHGSNHRVHANVQDNESDDQDFPILTRKAKLVIPDSDSEADGFNTSQNDEPAPGTKDTIDPESSKHVSSFNKLHQASQSRRGAVLKIDSSDSDDSIKISPTRRARFNAERAKMLSSHGCPSLSSLEGLPSQTRQKSTATKQANLTTAPIHAPQPMTIQHPSAPGIIQPKTPKPRAPRSIAPNTIKKPPAAKRDIPFSKRRDELAERLIERLNSEIFNHMLPPELDLVWSNRLNTTAGKAKWSVFKDGTGKVVREKVVVELGTKVVDSERKLMNTLAHELCHVATWIIDRQKDEKHGRYFKAWASKIHKLIPEIHITTKHTYDIDYKYNWTCATPTCLQKYGRHSNSIKPDKQMCACGGTLVPVPRVRRRAVNKKVVQKEEDVNNSGLSLHDDDDEDDEDGLSNMMGNLLVKSKS